jgi:tetratricopeptide (TPR) repeat protein
VERRLAVLAGPDAPLRARRAAWLAALAVVASTGAAEARPRKPAARAQLDRGLAAYKKANYEAASQALQRSFELEADVDTLFAWAQAQRKLERCDRAIELYQQALGFDIPAANREVIERAIADCRALIASQAPPPVPEPLPVINPPAATPEPRPEPAPVVVEPPPPAPRESPSGWYRDPVALTLVGAGLVTTGVGAGLLVSARSLDRKFHAAPDATEARSLADQAHTRGNAGLITASVGGALVVGGIVWILTHRHREPRTVTGWLTPAGGGVAVTGTF